MQENKYQLEEMKRENPFKVPEGYFENFTNRIMDQLPEKGASTPTIIPLWSRIKPWMYAAAMIAGIVLLLNIFVIAPKSKNAGLNLTSSAEIDEFYQYYEEQLADKMYHETLYVEGLDSFEDIE
jgi:hypothetical protein